MDDEPRFFGDLLPPDDPRPGDVWLAKGVYRVRMEGRWEPDWTRPDDTLKSYRDMLQATWRRTGLKAWATRRKREMV
jgi:hypothetical protein